jgi:hypothetical protein
MFPEYFPPCHSVAVPQILVSADWSHCRALHHAEQIAFACLWFARNEVIVQVDNTDWKSVRSMQGY